MSIQSDETTRFPVNSAVKSSRVLHCGCVEGDVKIMKVCIDREEAGIREHRELRGQEEEWCAEIERNDLCLRDVERNQVLYAGIIAVFYCEVANRSPPPLLCSTDYRRDDDDSPVRMVLAETLQDRYDREYLYRLTARNDGRMALLSIPTYQTSQYELPPSSAQDLNSNGTMQSEEEEQKSEGNSDDGCVPADGFDDTCSIRPIRLLEGNVPWRLVLVDPEFKCL